MQQLTRTQINNLIKKYLDRDIVTESYYRFPIAKLMEPEDRWLSEIDKIYKDIYFIMTEYGYVQDQIDECIILGYKYSLLLMNIPEPEVEIQGLVDNAFYEIISRHRKYWKPLDDWRTNLARRFNSKEKPSVTNPPAIKLCLGMFGIIYLMLECRTENNPRLKCCLTWLQRNVKNKLMKLSQIFKDETIEDDNVFFRLCGASNKISRNDRLNLSMNIKLIDEKYLLAHDGPFFWSSISHKYEKYQVRMILCMLRDKEMQLAYYTHLEEWMQNEFCSSFINTYSQYWYTESIIHIYKDFGQNIKLVDGNETDYEKYVRSISKQLHFPKEWIDEINNGTMRLTGNESKSTPHMAMHSFSLNKLMPSSEKVLEPVYPLCTKLKGDISEEDKEIIDEIYKMCDKINWQLNLTSEDIKRAITQAVGFADMEYTDEEKMCASKLFGYFRYRKSHRSTPSKPSEFYYTRETFFNIVGWFIKEELIDKEEKGTYALANDIIYNGCVSHNNHIKKGFKETGALFSVKKDINKKPICYLEIYIKQLKDYRSNPHVINRPI